MKNIKGFMFEEEIAERVQELVDAIEDKFGSGICYPARTGLNFALRAGEQKTPDSDGKRAFRMFARIRNAIDGVELRRTKIPQAPPLFLKIASTDLDKLMRQVEIWHRETVDIKKPIGRAFLQKGPFVAGGLPETKRNKF